MTSLRKNKTVSINAEAYGTLELIKNGVLSKFDALMDAEEARQAHKSGYFNGEPMPYSFVFAPYGKLNQKVVGELKNGERVELLYGDAKVGHIDVRSVFKFSDDLKEKNIFLANERANDDELNLGELAVSGEFEIYDETIKNTKAKISAIKKEQNVSRITALFLTADPLNRAHERVIRMTIDKTDLVVIFLVRTLQEPHIDYDLRLKTLEYFVQNYLPANRAVVFALKNTTLFSSHQNPTLECIAARRLGADKLVIGQNHGGLGMFFDHNRAHTILDCYPNELKMEVIVLPELVYCNRCRTLVSTKTCPHGQHHHIKYRPETLKSLLFNGIIPPAILMRPDISAFILSELFPQRFSDIQKLCDELFPNSGLLEKRSEREFYEELMKLYQTSSMT